MAIYLSQFLVGEIAKITFLSVCLFECATWQHTVVISLAFNYLLYLITAREITAVVMVIRNDVSSPRHTLSGVQLQVYRYACLPFILLLDCSSSPQ